MNKFWHVAGAALAGFIAALPRAEAFPQRVSDADVLEIRAIISRQIDAFRHGDANEAFTLASPRIRSAFRTPENFLRGVRTAFAPITRSASVAFRTALILDDEVVQQLKVTDSSGEAWRVFYPMQRQTDGSWRANGFQLEREAAVSI